jgi:hypothetical protein
MDKNIQQKEWYIKQTLILILSLDKRLNKKGFYQKVLFILLFCFTVTM